MGSSELSAETLDEIVADAELKNTEQRDMLRALVAMAPDKEARLRAERDVARDERDEWRRLARDSARLRAERDEAQAERDLWADRAMEFEAERNSVLTQLHASVQAHAKTTHRLEDMAARLEEADNGR